MCLNVVFAILILNFDTRLHRVMSFTTRPTYPGNEKPRVSSEWETGWNPGRFGGNRNFLFQLGSDVQPEAHPVYRMSYSRKITTEYHSKLLLKPVNIQLAKKFLAFYVNTSPQLMPVLHMCMFNFHTLQMSVPPKWSFPYGSLK